MRHTLSATHLQPHVSEPNLEPVVDVDVCTLAPWEPGRAWVLRTEYGPRLRCIVLDLPSFNVA
jgi:hypothetical protein